jgi:uncharacterized RDD family membrane protein YckC
MSDKLKEIQTAIDNFQMDKARRLVHEELQDNPSADAYYLGSQAAANHGQRVEYLERTIELDPFHQIAHDELASLLTAGMNVTTVPTPSDSPKPKAKNTPHYVLAPIGKRFLALFIDTIILGVITVVYSMLFGPTLPDTATLEEILSLDEFRQYQMSLMVSSVLISAVYYIYFMTSTNGQTPGKKALGIRIIKKDRTTITFIDALLRNVIGYTLSGIFQLGYIWAIFDGQKQGWHDKVAGTVVVEDKKNDGISI